MVCMWVLLSKTGRKKICNNRYTLSTHIDLYDIPHIFYTQIIHTHCLQMLTGYYWYMDIYIYIYICMYLSPSSSSSWLQEKINDLMYVDEIKIFAKKLKEVNTIKQTEKERVPLKNKKIFQN